MGTLHTSWKDALGVSHADELVAVFENGKIYMATDGFLGSISKGALIGEYENGIVYTVETGTLNYGKRLNAVAVIENGTIYGISKNMLGGFSKSLSVGSCSYGKVYSQSHKIMEENELAGLYDGDVEGAAAAAAIVLFRLESNVSAYEDSGYGRRDPDNSRGSTSGSSGETDGLEDFFSFLAFIFKTIGFLFLLAFWLVKWVIRLLAGPISKFFERMRVKSYASAARRRKKAETTTNSHRKAPPISVTAVSSKPSGDADKGEDISRVMSTSETPSTIRAKSTEKPSETKVSQGDSNGFKPAGDL